MIEFFTAVYDMFFQAAFYLVIGFAVAGMLRYVLSEERFLRWFGKDDFGTVMLASLLGIPLPLCSCSVLPVAVAMRQRGASRGAVTSFVISTPETGVDSIALTYALLDPIMTVVRPIAAFLTALVTGSAVSWFSRKGYLEGDGINGGAGGEAPASGCGCEAKPSEGGGASTGGETAQQGSEAVTENGRAEGSFWFKSMRYGFVTLPNDLVSVLCFAFVCSGVIAVAVPDRFFDTPLAQGFPAMLIMLVVGIPFYICATASTPIAAMLMLKGLSPGAALVFLLAGPATNLGSVFALAKFLGKKTIAIYLVCISGLSLLLGAAVDSIYADYGVDPVETVGQVSEMIPGFLKVAAAVFFFAILARAAWVTGMFKQWAENIRRACKPLGFDPLGRAAAPIAGLVLVAAYASTCFTVVNVGEVGWVHTFGHVTRDLDRPGLYVHYPFPFETVSTMRPQEVRTIEFGFRRDEKTKDATLDFLADLDEINELASEAEMMNGEEAIVSLKFSVHFNIKDPYLYVFRNTEPLEAVRNFAASTLRVICSRLDTDRILVGDRPAFEEETRVLLQAELDRAETGVEILEVTFWDVHAPPSVHYAFRDVASADEDKHKKKLKAESVANETLALARGESYRIIREAMMYAARVVSEAGGRAASFEAVAAAYAKSPALTGLRLYVETMEKILAPADCIVPFDEGIDIELWMKEGAAPPFIEDEAGKQTRPAGDTYMSPSQRLFGQEPLDRPEKRENPFRKYMEGR